MYQRFVKYYDSSYITSGCFKIDLIFCKYDMWQKSEEQLAILAWKKRGDSKSKLNLDSGIHAITDNFVITYI